MPASVAPRPLWPPAAARSGSRYAGRPLSRTTVRRHPDELWEAAKTAEAAAHPTWQHRLETATEPDRARWTDAVQAGVLLAARLRQDLDAWPAVSVTMHPSLAQGEGIDAQRLRRIHSGLEWVWDPAQQYHFGDARGTGPVQRPRILWQLLADQGQHLGEVRPVVPTVAQGRYPVPYDVSAATRRPAALDRAAGGVWLRLFPGRPSADPAPSRLGGGGHRPGSAGDQTHWLATQLAPLGLAPRVFDRWNDLALPGDVLLAWARTVTPQQAREAFGHYLRLDLSPDDHDLRPWVLQQLAPRLGLETAAPAAVSVLAGAPVAETPPVGRR